MTAGNPTPVSPTRDPVGHGRAFVEGAVILTPLATIVAWLMTLLPMQVPGEVQNAFVGLLVTVGTLCFSEWRNRQYQTGLLSRARLVTLALTVPLVAAVGCVAFNRSGYKELAGGEIVRLRQTSDSVPLEQGTCDALSRGAVMLRDKDGSQKSLNLPFFAGQHVGTLASRHDRVAAVCSEMVRREQDRGVTVDHRGQLRIDWIRDWQNGRALLGGPEEE